MFLLLLIHLRTGAAHIVASLGKGTVLEGFRSHSSYGSIRGKILLLILLLVKKIIPMLLLESLEILIG